MSLLLCSIKWLVVAKEQQLEKRIRKKLENILVEVSIFSGNNHSKPELKIATLEKAAGRKTVILLNNSLEVVHPFNTLQAFYASIWETVQDIYYAFFTILTFLFPSLMTFTLFRG